MSQTGTSPDPPGGQVLSASVAAQRSVAARWNRAGIPVKSTRASARQLSPLPSSSERANGSTSGSLCRRRGGRGLTHRRLNGAAGWCSLKQLPEQSGGWVSQVLEHGLHDVPANELRDFLTQIVRWGTSASAAPRASGHARDYRCPRSAASRRDCQTRQPTGMAREGLSGRGR